MKQMTEDQLRRILLRAYQEGARLAKPHSFLKTAQKVRQRDEFIETIIQSL